MMRLFEIVTTMFAVYRKQLLFAAWHLKVQFFIFIVDFENIGSQCGWITPGKDSLEG
jgi:hypothetical protein